MSLSRPRPGDGKSRYRPQGEDCPGGDRCRVVVAGGQGRAGDLGEVTELGHDDYREAGGGDRQNPGALPRTSMCSSPLSWRPRSSTAGREQSGHDDLQRTVLKQAQEAAGCDSKRHVHGEGGRDSGIDPHGR
jgi:hypothetical protein